MFNTNYSASNISIKNTPIQQIKIGRDKAAASERPFDKAIDVLTPGDIFTLRETHGRLDDGLYLVNYKDDINKGLNLTKLDDSDDLPVQTDNYLVTADNADGMVEIAGSLNVLA